MELRTILGITMVCFATRLSHPLYSFIMFMETYFKDRGNLKTIYQTTMVFEVLIQIDRERRERITYSERILNNLSKNIDSK
jgi:hypothetical protein